MGWIFDTYSSVYNTAMMHDVKNGHQAADTRKAKTRSMIARLFYRAA